MNQDSSSKTNVLPIDIPKFNIQSLNSPTTSSFTKKSSLKVDVKSLTRKPSLEVTRSLSPTRLFGTSPITFIPWMQSHHDNSHLGVSPPNLPISRPESPVSPGQVCKTFCIIFIEKYYVFIYLFVIYFLRDLLP
jgi:hypothetical protein